MAVVLGPKEPADLAPYLQERLEVFKEHGPAGTPLEVTEHTVEDGQVRQKTIQHTILLGGVYGDSPGIKKLALWLGHAAYLGCGYCLLKGTYLQRAMRYLGYAKKTHSALQDQHDPSKCLEVYCGDARVLLDEEKQRARDDLVASGKLTAEQAGTHGMSCIVEALPYVDYQQLFLAPIAHAGFGAVKDFWNYVLSNMDVCMVNSRRARAAISSRASHLIPTCAFVLFSYVDSPKNVVLLVECCIIWGCS